MNIWVFIKHKGEELDLTGGKGNLWREVNIPRQLWQYTQLCCPHSPLSFMLTKHSLSLLGSWNIFSSLGVQTCTHLSPEYYSWLTVLKMEISGNLVRYKYNVSSERIKKKSILVLFPANVTQLHSSAIQPWKFMGLSMDFSTEWEIWTLMLISFSITSNGREQHHHLWRHSGEVSYHRETTLSAEELNLEKKGASIFCFSSFCLIQFSRVAQVCSCRSLDHCIWQLPYKVTQSFFLFSFPCRFFLTHPHSTSSVCILISWVYDFHENAKGQVQLRHIEGKVRILLGVTQEKI